MWKKKWKLNTDKTTYRKKKSRKMSRGKHSGGFESSNINAKGWMKIIMRKLMKVKSRCEIRAVSETGMTRVKSGKRRKWEKSYKRDPQGYETD